jgi:phenylpropionate dioxygenase-like ring-hydroxylating dioxygenase large terminal subunit
MGPVTAHWLDELGYDPDDGVPVLESLSEVPVGAVIRARAGARLVAVARLTSGKLVIVEDECPHDGGRISDGYVEGERLVCARHGWELDVQGQRCVRAASCGRSQA